MIRNLVIRRFTLILLEEYETKLIISIGFVHILFSVTILVLPYAGCNLVFNYDDSYFQTN